METDIFRLIKEGDGESIRRLLFEEPLIINVKKPPHCSSLLHYAVSCLQIELVKLLAGRIGDINEMDGLGRTCLHYASWEGSCDIAKILIDSGADVNAREGTSGDGKTPLHRAAENGHADMVDLLLKTGADPKVTINRRPYKLHEVLEDFPDTKWIVTPKDCASTRAIQGLFEKYERPPC